MNDVILLIGKISSGKSSIAKLLESSNSESLIISFGGYLKYYCEQNNLKIERETLQNIGNSFIKSNPDLFLNNVIEFNEPSPNKLIIFEGIRHESIFNSICKKYNNNISVFLDIDKEIRYSRYKKRNKDIDKPTSYAEFIELDNHEVEQEVNNLKNKCTLIIENEDLEKQTTLIIDALISLKRKRQS